MWRCDWGLNARLGWALELTSLLAIYSSCKRLLGFRSLSISISRENVSGAIIHLPVAAVLVSLS